MKKVLLLTAALLLLTGCSSSAGPDAFLGRGQSFTEAADIAVTQAFEENVFWWLLNGKSVGFVYDKDGSQAKGSVTIYAVSNGPGNFAFGYVHGPADMDYRNMAHLVLATLPDLVPRMGNGGIKVCVLVGFDPPAPWETCGIFGCPKYDCYWWYPKSPSIDGVDVGQPE